MDGQSKVEKGILNEFKSGLKELDELTSSLASIRQRMREMKQAAQRIEDKRDIEKLRRDIGE